MCVGSFIVLLCGNYSFYHYNTTLNFFHEYHKLKIEFTLIVYYPHFFSQINIYLAKIL